VLCVSARSRSFRESAEERLAKFGLEVAADKTKTLRFGSKGGLHNGRFDFLGFEFYWEPDRQASEGETTDGHQEMASRNPTDDRMGENAPSPQAGRMMKTLKAKLRGTWNYYGSSAIIGG